MPGIWHIKYTLQYRYNIQVPSWRFWLVSWIQRRAFDIGSLIFPQQERQQPRRVQEQPFPSLSFALKDLTWYSWQFPRQQELPWPQRRRPSPQGQGRVPPVEGAVVSHRPNLSLYSLYVMLCLFWMWPYKGRLKRLVERLLQLLRILVSVTLDFCPYRQGWMTLEGLIFLTQGKIFVTFASILWKCENRLMYK